jgi:L-amino acid N-acyltransferase YncA
MNVTYATEQWSDVWREMAPLWEAHWLEVALDHEAVPLAPDIAAYDALEAAGMLNVLVARKAGQVIGYHLAIVKPHLHYKNSLHSFTDIYYVAPEHRQGMTGVKLFKEAEKSLAKRGVKKMVSGTKMSLDMGKIFERLGWRETERTYTKCIGE